MPKKYKLYFIQKAREVLESDELLIQNNSTNKNKKPQSSFTTINQDNSCDIIDHNEKKINLLSIVPKNTKLINLSGKNLQEAIRFLKKIDDKNRKNAQKIAKVKKKLQYCANEVKDKNLDVLSQIDDIKFDSEKEVMDFIEQNYNI